MNRREFCLAALGATTFWQSGGQSSPYCKTVFQGWRSYRYCYTKLDNKDLIEKMRRVLRNVKLQPPVQKEKDYAKLQH